MRGIYRIRNRVTGDCYIGSALDVEKRWAEHRSKLRKGEYLTLKSDLKPHFQRAWNKYGESQFEFICILELPVETSIEAFGKIETFYLNLYWPTGYNTSKQGRRPPRFDELPLDVQQQIREKKRQSNLLKNQTPEGIEANERRRRSLLGRSLSEETKEKIRDGNLGKSREYLGGYRREKGWTHSEETKKKMKGSRKK